MILRVQMEGSSHKENKFIQNALIGQQDISKFYKDNTTKQIFSKVSKLCEIGLPTFLIKSQTFHVHF